MCEQLLDAWVENVAIARNQCESWELKLQNQVERVDKTKAELTTVEELMMEKNVVVDSSLTQLQALDSALATL